MGAAMKLLIMAALLRMGACKCWFNGEKYTPTQYLEIQGINTEETCFKPWCNLDGHWEYTGGQNFACGNCSFGGEPLVYTFDSLISIDPSYSVDPSRLISVNGNGEHVMTQPRIVLPDHTPDFGVTGHFVSDYVNGGQCNAPGYTNCIDGLIYYEKDNAVKLVLNAMGIIEVYWLSNYEKWNSASWKNPASKVAMGPGVAFLPKGISTADVKILVIEATPIIGGGRDCTIVIGTQGLTVTLCKEAAFYLPFYPWSGIYAMPKLQSASAYPSPYEAPILDTPDRLYGLCNSWTDAAAITTATSKCFYKQNEGVKHGVCENGWQGGRSKDHQTEKWDIRKLDWTVTKSWKIR